MLTFIFSVAFAGCGTWATGTQPNPAPPPPPPPALASGQPVADKPHGIAAHAELGFLLPPGGGRIDSNSTPAMATAGVGIGYDVRPNLELEAAVSTTASTSRITKDGSRSNIDDGTILRALVHWQLHETGFGPLLGAGPAVIVGSTFGTVPLLHLEGGIEYRAAPGFYFALVYQMVEPLMTSRPDVDPAQCSSSDCPSRFNPSNPILGIRMAVGFAF